MFRCRQQGLPPLEDRAVPKGARLPYTAHCGIMTRNSHGEEGETSRPTPGSKNKSTLAKVGKLANSVSKMDVWQLRDYIAGLETTLTAKVQQQREYLKGQLAGLQIYADNKAGAAVRAIMRVPNTRSAPRPSRNIRVRSTSGKWSAAACCRFGCVKR